MPPSRMGYAAPMWKARTLLWMILLPSLACSPSPAARRGTAAEPAPRQPARVLSWEGGADWLERDERARIEKPEVVLKAMDLKDGDVVADLGAGTGFYTRRLARAVAPSGTIWANDIQPEMLDRLRELAAKEGIGNVVTVLGTETDPKLPRGTFDWILLVDVYHEFQRPEPMLRRIREALKPDGRVALVEYRAEDGSATHIHELHRMSVEQILAEWVPAGFVHVETIEELPSQHLLVFSVE